MLAIQKGTFFIVTLYYLLTSFLYCGNTYSYLLLIKIILIKKCFFLLFQIFNFNFPNLFSNPAIVVLEFLDIPFATLPS